GGPRGGRNAAERDRLVRSRRRDRWRLGHLVGAQGRDHVGRSGGAFGRGVIPPPPAPGWLDKLRVVSSTRRPARVVVLVSGSGTNLQALFDATSDASYGAEVVAVGSDRPDIEGLRRAERS